MVYREGYIFKDDNEYSDVAKFCNENVNYFIEELTQEDIEQKKLDKIDDFDNVIRYFIVRKTPEPTAQEKLEAFKNDIINSFQSILDDKAKEKGYDNGFALASYSTSTDEKFREEAIAFIQWRDKSWRYLYNLLDDFLAGKIQMKSKEEIVAGMPKLEWLE